MSNNKALYGLLCAVFMSMLTGCGDKKPEKQEVVRPVKAMQVSDVSNIATRSFPGRAKAFNEVDLAFRVSGTLIELPNDIIGREFKTGELIARLDPRDYEVSVRNDEGRLEKARANAKQAQSDYRRELNILKEDPGATSQAMVDRKRALRDQSRAEVSSLQASLEAAQDNLSYTYLKAPFDGEVVANYVENFQDVRAKQKVVRLLDRARIKMVVDIPENLISNLPYVSDIQVTFDAFPDQPVPAEIFEVGREASLTTRTYPITLVMNQAEEFKILAGMAGRARGIGNLPEDNSKVGMQVPVGAVFTPNTEKKNYVWVIDEKIGTVSRRAVITGELIEGGIIIKEGLKPGEWIAIAGVHSLREGQKVRILRDSEA